MRQKSYTVAGHCFSLSFPDSLEIPGGLSNYLPFESGSENEAEFCLEVTDSLPEGPKTIIYRGQDEDPGMARLDIFNIPDGMLVEMALTQKAPVCATLVLLDGLRKGLLKIYSNAKFAVDNSLMLMYAFCTAGSGTLEMHASTVLSGGKAYLFLGKSGAGKSTHSRLWLENIPGATLLNDDNPIVRIFPDGEVRAYGSPWSGKTPCYVKQNAPVGAVVSIKKAPHNAIRRLDLLEAYATIYPSCSGFREDRAMSDALHDSIAAFASEVPAYELECLPDADAAFTCNKAVANGE